MSVSREKETKLTNIKTLRQNLRVFCSIKIKLFKMKNYKLNYKDKDGKVLVTLGLLANDATEAVKQCHVLLENCLDKRVKSVELAT